MSNVQSGYFFLFFSLGGGGIPLKGILVNLANTNRGYPYSGKQPDSVLMFAGLGMLKVVGFRNGGGGGTFSPS